jgi:hypothetical protein
VVEENKNRENAKWARVKVNRERNKKGNTEFEERERKTNREENEKGEKNIERG